MGRIDSFLAQYSRENTKKLYSTALRVYLRFIYGLKYSKKASIDYETLADRYFSESRDYVQDVIAFSASFSGSPPKTARTYIAAVKEFCRLDGVLNHHL